ncbi:MAG: tetratricopeptide repeat protein [Arenimonas sp.]
MRHFAFPCLLLFCALAATAPAFARPALRVPVDTTEIIERLPRGYAVLTPRAGRTPAPTVAAAALLLESAARSGDARLARRAEAMLATFADIDDAGLLRTRAFAAQHRHDFVAAIALLDRAIALDPRDGGLRLARAQVALVQGRVRAARKDCGALAFGVDGGLGLACTAAIALRTGRHQTAAQLSGQWLAAAPAGDGSRVYVTLLRAEAAARSGEADAARWFRAAVALDPVDVRTLSAFARYLVTHGHADAVRPLLRDAGDSQGIAQLRMLAAVAADDDDAGALVEAQAGRFALSRQLGQPTELRDEAELALVARGRAADALALAIRNFHDQRDFEDVRLLQRAAAAAHAPQSLEPLRTWARAEGIALADAP